MKKYYDICRKEIYTSQGQEKTKWHKVGTLRVMDDGKQFIDLPLLGPSLYVFEQKERNEAHKTASQASSDFRDDELPTDTPF